MYTHTNTYIYIYIYTHTHTQIHEYIYTHKYTYIHTHKYTYIYTHKYTYIYTHKYTYKYTYIRCNTHTHTHTNTHIHTQKYIDAYQHASINRLPPLTVAIHRLHVFSCRRAPPVPCMCAHVYMYLFIQQLSPYIVSTCSTISLHRQHMFNYLLTSSAHVQLSPYIVSTCSTISLHRQHMFFCHQVMCVCAYMYIHTYYHTCSRLVTILYIHTGSLHCRHVFPFHRAAPVPCIYLCCLCV